MSFQLALYKTTKDVKHGRPEDTGTAVEAVANGDAGLNRIAQILCSRIYPEMTLRWGELFCTEKQPSN
jgi:hypothetical protein